MVLDVPIEEMGLKKSLPDQHEFGIGLYPGGGVDKIQYAMEIMETG